MIDLTQMLPDWDFVGGSTQNRSFQLSKPSGAEYDLQSGSAVCTVRDYVNEGAPVISKSVDVSAAESGRYCVVSITLSGDDTKGLDGLYLYQIAVTDSAGNVAIPFHGRMHIIKNLTPSAAT